MPDAPPVQRCECGGQLLPSALPPLKDYPPAIIVRCDTCQRVFVNQRAGCDVGADIPGGGAC
jgi:cystathionine beta-lyase family protein involved in aluminum resistance